MNTFEQLKAPFMVSRVSWRVGARTKDGSKCIPLAYIDARDVMQRLEEVMGPENWQCRYPHVGKIVICEIGLRVGDEWLWRANGAGETQVEGEKGSCSDAFKRAAVLWGIGRYLYALPNVWVPLNGNKFDPPKLPAWATPEGYASLMAERAA